MAGTDLLGTFRVPLPTDAPAYRRDRLPLLNIQVCRPGPPPATERQRFPFDPLTLAPVLHVAHQLDSAVVMEDRHLLDHELVMVLAGTGQARIGRETRRYQPGTLLLIPPFTEHQVFAFDRRQAAHLAVHFDFAPHSSLAADPPQRLAYEIDANGRSPLPAFPGSADRNLLTQLQQVIRGHHHADPLRQRASSLGFGLILLDLLGRAEAYSMDEPGVSVAGGHPAVIRAQQLLGAALDRDWTVPDLAEACGISASRLGALFRAETGLTPMRFLKALRMQAAVVSSRNGRMIRAALCADC
jgi:AraC-like DNA-binding protein